ncbi:MAG: DNA polymerase III subunit beta, partial [Oscillospiraceae bacterium]|nr:DNA polymerase III subunit beta [Oscillospiraceae bacterium]
DEEDDSKFIVPGKTLAEISKLLSDEDEKYVTISFGRKHITFDLDDYKVSSRLLEGTFLEYRHSVPDEVNLSVRVNTREFIEGLERVSLLITEKLRGDLSCKFENDTIMLSCDTTTGRATDVVNCKMEGEPVEMSFNSRYLIEALKYSECDEVKIGIKSAKLSPVLMIKPIEGDSLLYLVLPLR